MQTMGDSIYSILICMMLDASISVHFERSNTFTLRVLTINVWGFKAWAEEKQVRMSAIADFINKTEYDVVLIQEAWYNKDYQILKDTLPYSSFYGALGSLLCPPSRNNQSFYTQLLPLDCHGLMILSNHKILNMENIFFKDRIPKLRESFVMRGALDVTLNVSKVVAGETKTLKVSAINTHLATWYSDSEELWTSVREKQADDVLTLIAAQMKHSDLVILAGDLNSTPKSSVYKKFISAGLTDTLVDLKSESANTAPKYVTYGHDNNTWTGPGSGEFKSQDRLDYILFTHGNGIEAKASVNRTVDAKTGLDGEMFSLSDHMPVEANIRITFNMVIRNNDKSKFFLAET